MGSLTREICPPANALRGARVLVTGGNGFLGRHLVTALVEEQASVTVLGRTPCMTFPPIVNCICADLASLGRPLEADYVFHLASLTGIQRTEANPVQTFRVNVLGTLNLLTHCRVGVRLIFASSGAVYGDPGTGQVQETAHLAPLSVYGFSKLIGEQMIEFYARRMTFEYTIARIFTLYGEGHREWSLVGGLFRCALQQDTLEVQDGQTVLDLLHATDGAQALLRLACSPQAANKVCNVGTGKPTSILELARKVALIVGKPSVQIRDRQSPGEVGPRALWADNSKLVSCLNWRPELSLEEGLIQTYNFMRARAC